jgi:hypothetical protein
MPDRSLMRHRLQKLRDDPEAVVLMSMDEIKALGGRVRLSDGTVRRLLVQQRVGPLAWRVRLSPRNSSNRS